MLQLSLQVLTLNSNVKKLDKRVFFSVTHGSIKNVAFPAVTVCYPLSLTKGYSVTQALLYFDQEGQVLDLLKDGAMLNDFKESVDTRLVRASNTYRKTVEFKELVNTKSYKALENLMGKDLQKIAHVLHFLSFNIYKSNTANPEFLMSLLVEDVIKRFNEMQWQGKGINEIKEALLNLICNGADFGKLCQNDAEIEMDEYCQSESDQISVSKKPMK